MTPSAGESFRLTVPVETDRLVVRRFEPGDWPSVLAYASNPEVMRFLPEGIFDEARAREFVVGNCGEAADERAVTLRSDGPLIGHLVFHLWVAPRTYEIGWVVHPDHQGRGYATEAARALLGLAFERLGAHRVIATCQPENPASCHVAEKLGMRREGHFRACIHRDDGQWWDEYFYAILEEEWPRGEEEWSRGGG
jgi:[ribosomal protein S5]-alanine N-acetyltransferase